MPDAVALSTMLMGTKPRQALAMMLAWLAYGLYYVVVAVLLFAVPAWLGFLILRWMTG